MSTAVEFLRKNQPHAFGRTLVIMTYQLKEGFLSFDALGYNATLAQEVRFLL